MGEGPDAYISELSSAKGCAGGKTDEKGRCSGRGMDCRLVRSGWVKE